MGKELAPNPWSAGTPGSDWNALVFMAAIPQQQYAFEAYIDGEFRGAFSYAAIRAIRAAAGKLTPSHLVEQTADWLHQNGFPQQPQLLGKLNDRRKAVFG
jgi:hypothetical protein